MGDREEACGAAPVPASFAESLAGYRWARDTVGESGGAVYRLHGSPAAADVYLKHGGGATAADITDEMVRLRWLDGRLPAPAVTHFVADPEEAWLLMTAVPGRSAWQVLDTSPDDRQATVDALARFMKRLHALPVSDCPFAADHLYRVARARERIDAGLVDEEDFDPERAGWSAEQVWDAMQQLLPLHADPVVTHGDFSLDNLLIHDGEVVGCIDVGRLGIADRYQDLAILWNCLGDFDAALQERLFASYGIAEPDRRKLQFHLLLDELF